MSIVVPYTKTGNVVLHVIDRELESAAIPVDHTAWEPSSELVILSYNDSATSGDMAAGEAIVVAHDGTDPWLDISDGAETQISNIPAWATWTETHALTWYATNIDAPLAAASNLPEAKAVLTDMADVQKRIIRMVIAMRNKHWPHLQE